MAQKPQKTSEERVEALMTRWERLVQLSEKQRVELHSIVVDYVTFREGLKADTTLLFVDKCERLRVARAEYINLVESNLTSNQKLALRNRVDNLKQNKHSSQKSKEERQ